MDLKRLSQLFWEILHRFVLRRMNYGNGGDYIKSGELNVFKIIRKGLTGTNELVIFDVGANVGNYTLALSKYFKDKASIFSFEPSLKTFNILKSNTQEIGNVILNNIGLSDCETTSTLFSDKEGSGLASLYHRKLDHFNIEMDSSEDIKLTTVDRYCELNSIERIHFLKLDIEGNELNALKGAKRMIDKQAVDYIQFEFGGCNIDSKTYFQDYYYLLKDNYRIFRVLRNGLFEITRYNESYEIFKTVNYLAIKR